MSTLVSTIHTCRHTWEKCRPIYYKHKIKKEAKYFFEAKKITSFVYLINHTNTCMYIYIYYLKSLKFTLKDLKRTYMFRSHDHPQGAYIVPC